MLPQALAQTGIVAHLMGQQLLSEEEQAAARAAAKKAKKDRQKARKLAHQHSSQSTDQDSVKPSSAFLSSISTLALQG